MTTTTTEPDSARILFNALENPTKLNIIFLLSRHSKMTVTQMAEHVKVGRPNLYHFVNEMVKEGLLLKPEVQVKGNYVEKYYQLNKNLFESQDPKEHRRLLKNASPDKLSVILRSSLAAFGLELRLIAEDLARADTKTKELIAKSVINRRIGSSYSILSDEAYDYVMVQLRKLFETVEKRWGDEKMDDGNRVMIVAIPNLQPDKPITAKTSSSRDRA